MISYTKSEQSLGFVLAWCSAAAVGFGGGFRAQLGGVLVGVSRLDGCLLHELRGHGDSLLHGWRRRWSLLGSWCSWCSEFSLLKFGKECLPFLSEDVLHVEIWNECVQFMKDPIHLGINPLIPFGLERSFLTRCWNMGMLEFTPRRGIIGLTITSFVGSLISKFSPCCR